MKEKIRELFKNVVNERKENCPDETMLVFFVNGRLNKYERKLVEKHIRECFYCLNKITELKENEYLYKKSQRKGLFSGIITILSPFYWKKYVLAFVSIFIIIALLFLLNIEKQTLSLNPSSIVRIQAVDAAETVKTEFKGVIVSSDGYVVTTLYPILGSKRLLLKLHDGSTYSVRNIWADRERNIAVIKIDTLPNSIKPAIIADTVNIGQEVIVIPITKGRPDNVIVSDLKHLTSRTSKKEFSFIQLVSMKKITGDGIVIDRNGNTLGITSVKDGKILFAGLIKEAINEIRNKNSITLEMFNVKDENRLAEALSNYFKGIIAMDSKNLDMAEQLFKKAIEFEPQLERPYLELARVYYQKRLYDLEIEQYRKVLKINPENTDALFFLAQAYETKGWYKEATELYKKVINIEPEDAEAIFNLGLAYLTVGERDKAINLYTELKRLDPGYAKKLRRLSESH